VTHYSFREDVGAFSESARSPVTSAGSVQASGRLLQLYFASDAPGDWGWERLQRLSERARG